VKGGLLSEHMTTFSTNKGFYQKHIFVLSVLRADSETNNGFGPKPRESRFGGLGGGVGLSPSTGFYHQQAFTINMLLPPTRMYHRQACIINRHVPSTGIYHQQASTMTPARDPKQCVKENSTNAPSSSQAPPRLLPPNLGFKNEAKHFQKRGQFSSLAMLPPQARFAPPLALGYLTFQSWNLQNLNRPPGARIGGRLADKSR